MNELKFKSQFNLPYVEECLSRIEMEPSASMNLVFPVNIKYRGFGNFPALIQLFNTWLRNEPGNLIIPIEENENELLEKFACSYHGFYTLSMAWRKVKILDVQMNESKYRFLPHTGEMYKRINFLDKLPKEDVLLPCYDHLPTKKGLTDWLYLGETFFPENEGDLDSNLYRVLDLVIQNYRRGIGEQVFSMLTELSAIIWELMKNTHEWARKDHLNEKVLSPNGRGVFIKFHKSTIRKFREFTDGHEPLMQYMQREEDLEFDKVKYYLEVSVFDSGPGLVKRYLGEKWNEDISIDEQVKIVKQCLTVHSTSATGIEKEHKGAGLDRTLSLLSKIDGFMRIRSGNVGLYRDLVKDAYIKGAESDSIQLNDWTSYDDQKFTKMSNAVGTTITLACPLN